MNELQQLCHAVHQSTRQTVEAAWPAEPSASALLDWTAAALNHVGGTIAGFCQVSRAEIDCRAGCSFCCWLQIDVRAHEVLLITRHLQAAMPESGRLALAAGARRTAAELRSMDDGARRREQRPCLLLKDGLCSVYEWRPAACRRYVSGSVAACEAQWKGEAVEEGIQYPLIAETGRAAAAAVHQTFVREGYDGYSYNLPVALAEALDDPTAADRWLRKEKVFSAEAESRTPAGFSQTQALTGLRAALAAAASRAGLLVLLLWSAVMVPGLPAAEPGGPPAPASRPLNEPGNHARNLTVDGLARSWMVHVPGGMDWSRPVPVVLLLHGAGMNGAMMASFSGMNAQAATSKFIAVYPNGTGLAETFLTWNSGGIGPVRKQPDDVRFIRLLLDNLAGELKVDPLRVYAAGLSNGGMMAYRLAAELSDRIAAIAAVGGTLALPDPAPGRPVSAMHFHGTEDRIVPYAGPRQRHPGRMSFLSVPETIAVWTRLTNCPPEPVSKMVPDRFEDATTVRISTYGPGKRGSEVVLVDIVGGGHTWPGQKPPVSWIGRSTREISANQRIWAFFEKHPMPEQP